MLFSENELSWIYTVNFLYYELCMVMTEVVLIPWLIDLFIYLLLWGYASSYIRAYTLLLYILCIFFV